MKVWVLMVSKKTEDDRVIYELYATEDAAEKAAYKYLDENPDGSASYWEEEVKS